MALLFSLLIPLIQVALHLAAGSGLFAAGTGPQIGVGVLYNLPDTLSDASWATQAKLGYITFSDLFTTEPHPATLFNLYFLTIGFLSRVVGIDPLSMMEYSSLLLGPLSVFAVLMVMRELKFNRATQVLSLILVFLGSGISGLMIVWETRGLHLLRPSAGRSLSRPLSARRPGVLSVPCRYLRTPGLHRPVRNANTLRGRRTWTAAPRRVAGCAFPCHGPGASLRSCHAKVEELKRAGLETSAPASDSTLLAQLVRNSRADYVLTRRTAAAMQAVTTCSHSKPVFKGDRWLAVGTSGWSCP